MFQKWAIENATVAPVSFAYKRPRTHAEPKAITDPGSSRSPLALNQKGLFGVLSPGPSVRRYQRLLWKLWD